MKTLFKNALVWQVNRFLPKDILIENEKILQVESGIPVPEDADITDLSGKFVVPGLIECHAHLCMNGGNMPMTVMHNSNTSQILMECMHSMDKLLHAGITTVRDCGSTGLEVIALRDEVEKKRFSGPRIFSCGMAIKMSGGHFTGKVVDSPYEARKAARELIHDGAQFLKFMGSGGLGREGEAPGVAELEIDEMKAAIEQGEKYQMSSAVHCHGKQSILNALEAGATSIEHCSYMDNEVIEKLLEKNAYIVPTFTPYVRIAENGVVPGTWLTPFVIRTAAEVNERKGLQFSNAYKAGVKIAFGRDSGATYTPHEDFLFEMKQMEAYGMSRADILNSATIIAAENLRMQDKVGSLDPGKFADLLVLHGNPMEDLANLEHAELILKGGAAIH